jgi:hypothetical protein
MDLIAELTILAALIQIAYQFIKKIILERFFQPVPDWLDQMSVLLLSLLVAYVLKANLLVLLENINLLVDTSNISPWVGKVLFALVISRGSSGVHELLNLLEKKRKSVSNLHSVNKPNKHFLFW